MGFAGEEPKTTKPSEEVEKDPFLIGFEGENLKSTTDGLYEFASGTYKPGAGVSFDPDTAKAELWDRIDKSNASEDNKAILRYYCENTDFQLTPDMNGPVAYDLDEDIVRYNPNFPLPEGVSLDGALAHELAHRADCLMFDVPNNLQWKTTIEQAAQALKSHEKEIVQWFKPKGIYYQDPYMCSIMDAIFQGSLDLPYGHKPTYWKKGNNREREIFANLYAMEVIASLGTKEFSQILAPLYSVWSQILKGG